jgi:hypothetical protein
MKSSAKNIWCWMKTLPQRANAQMAMAGKPRQKREKPQITPISRMKDIDYQ